MENAAEALKLYHRAFGAEEIQRAMDPSGKKVWHANFKIGNSHIFINDPFPDMSPAHPASLWIYTENVDAAFKRASETGMKVNMPPTDMFWGDRMASLTDKFNITWTVAQHVKDMTPDEMKKAQDAFVAQMNNKK